MTGEDSWLVVGFVWRLSSVLVMPSLPSRLSMATSMCPRVHVSGLRVTEELSIELTKYAGFATSSSMDPWAVPSTWTLRSVPVDFSSVLLRERGQHRG